jgi:hypothetical protein
MVHKAGRLPRDAFAKAEKPVFAYAPSSAATAVKAVISAPHSSTVVSQLELTRTPRRAVSTSKPSVANTEEAPELPLEHAAPFEI